MRKSIEKTILLADFHHPYHDEESWDVVKKFMRWFQPDRVVLVGDALEMRAIDHWKKRQGNIKYFEGKRLLTDYREFIKDVLRPIEKICPKAKKVYLGGNHEGWAYQLVNKFPQLEGTIEPEIAMKLSERGWEYVPYVTTDSAGNLRSGRIKVGKLTIAHGRYTNKYHASKNTEIYDKSVAYGHTHDLQLYTKVHEEDPGDYHTAQSIGCLCNKSPSFMQGRPNRWVHGFGVLYTRYSGFYNLYVPVIIKGQFVFAGKVFK
jgi:predicted phosphodiesterase